MSNSHVPNIVRAGRRQKLVLITTVSETLATILRGQPRFLAAHFDVTLICSGGEFCVDVASHEGVDLRSVLMVRGISPLRDLVSLWQMLRLLHELKPDIVHSYTPKAGLIGMFAARVLRVPVRVHTFTGLIFPSASPVLRFILATMDRFVCWCATDLVPEGVGVREDLRRFQITSKPLPVIGYGNIAGVDTYSFCRNAPGVSCEATKLRKRLSISLDSFVFCFIGRLNKDKGIHELVDAMKILPSSCRLLIAGDIDKSSPVSSKTKRLIASDPRIICVGFVRDVRPIMYASNILVLPSYREGFPNVLLEAGAMRLPAIATDVNGSNEIIHHDENGWIVPARSSAALAAAMSHAMRVPRWQLEEMGERGRDQVVAKFRRQEHWLRMRAFYEEIGRGSGNSYRQ